MFSPRSYLTGQMFCCGASVAPLARLDEPADKAPEEPEFPATGQAGSPC